MPSLIKLESVTSDGAVEILEADSGVLTIGREPENHIVVDSTSVSRRHCCITEAGSQWVFTDLGSTNGSSVNGQQIPPDGLRLLRNGDVIQVADFSIRLREVPDEYNGPNFSKSILVFWGHDFQAEKALEGESFSVGGDRGDIFVEGELRDKSQLRISAQGSRFELEVAIGSIPVMVNGAAVTGVTSLNDGDIIAIGQYVLLVNDGESSDSFQAQKLVAVGAANGNGVRAGDVFSRARVDNLSKDFSAEAGWESEAARRRAASGKKFVFGAVDDGDDASRTVSLPSYQFNEKASFESHPAQRFLNPHANGNRADDPAINEKLLVISGAVVVLALVGFLAFVFLF